MYGYATADIYYLEVCLFNQICTNGPTIFSVATGVEWRCDFSPTRFDELQRILQTPWREPDDANECW